ncbi:MAG: SDR family oxidoreductase [Caldilineaceae bacterium]
MASNGKTALITGGSRGIGRGIALKLAQSGANVAINYVVNEAAAKSTLAKVREKGGDGFIIQADVTQPDDIRHMFSAVQAEFGQLDIFVSNARPEAAAFFYPPLEITEVQWDSAVDSQAKAFLLGAREAAKLMPNGGRIVAITYAMGGVTGGLQPWVAMGAAKAAMESLVRYFAVGLAKRGITVNAISPSWTEDSVLNSLPEAVQNLQRNWHGAGWSPWGGWARRRTSATWWRCSARKMRAGSRDR